MNKNSVVAVMVTGILASGSALADINWSGWNNFVISDNTHADAAKKQQNLNLTQKNIYTLDTTINANKTNQDVVNTTQAATNSYQSAST